MKGKNPIRTVLKGTGDRLEIKEIYRTIQGEGPNTGTPAIFIRLGGCNLACDFCDTDFEDFGNKALDEIIKEAETLSLGAVKLAVITGGEPFRQPIERLCKRLLEKDFRVQIETNGTLYRPVDERVEIVCSPKNTGNGYAKIREDLLTNLSAIKFIISDFDSLYKETMEIGQTQYKIPVYVQPMDEGEEKNPANLRRTLEIAAKHGYKLSLQWHKMAGIK